VIMPLNDIATEQTTATKKTKTAADQLLDYLDTHPDATIRFHASDMILHIHSDASYLSVSKARRHLGGIFNPVYNTPNEEKLNGSILNVASVVKMWSHQQLNQKWALFFKLHNVHSTRRHIVGIRKQETSDSSENRQLYCLWNIKRNNQAKTVKIHGYEILLATRQSPLEAI
jgi:hypothetical protein